MGSSQIIKMKVVKILKKLGVSACVYHTSIGEAASSAENYAAVICLENFVCRFAAAEKKGVKIIALKNILDEKEIERKIIAADLSVKR